MSFPFHRPSIGQKEIDYVIQALNGRKLSGDGPFTHRCHEWLEKQLKTPKALLTHSCTAALEMACLLLEISPGDEVVMPSYTFVSTANAVALRGGIPVFIDIRPDTLNMNEKLLEGALSDKTKGVIPVHYAGVGCEMDTILEICRKRNIPVIEDAAQGFGSKYKNQALGTLGSFGALSFHETKNVTSGEGGALLVNDDHYILRAEMIREKGTDRSQFLRGQVDKYTWRDLGSSFLPNELSAALLFAQMEREKELNGARMKIWNEYSEGLKSLAQKGILKGPTIPKECEHNAHMYYILLDSMETRTNLIDHLKKSEIQASFHYIALHSSPGGKKYGRIHENLPVTDDLSHRLLRLPLYSDLKSAAPIIDQINAFFMSGSAR